MKKIVVLALGIGLIVGLVFLAMNMSKKSKVSDLSLIDFAVIDTASVDKITIYDTYFDREFTLIRNDEGVWTDTKGGCVQQEIPKMMLETMLKITLKGYVPQSAMENMKKQMMAKHKQVKIFQNGEWTKTWFVGHSTQDHMGTYMLLETPEKKSDNPVIMGMKGFYGILEPRFFTDERKFMCTELFSYKREELNSVEVINNVSPHESFRIEKQGNTYQVSSQGIPLQNINRNNLIYYLNGFEKIHFNQPNYTFSEKEIDSLKKVKPDYKLFIKGKNSDYSMTFYRRLDPDYSNADTTVYDEDYLWGVKEDGELVRMQFYTIGPLIHGQTVFVDNSVNN
ncbi:MAG: hypothetical protein R3277_08360 [Brumimicrobium sp.]|nr:hypothetical protein [Brumimicrobium sp.]